MFHVESILVPTDDSPCAAAAGSYAMKLATLVGARVHFLHVTQSGSADGQSPETSEFGSVGSRDDDHSPVEVVSASVEAPSVQRAIVRYAGEHGIGLIVMGTRARNWLNAPIGDVTHHVLRHAPCPVLTVRQALPQRGITRILAPVDFSEPGLEALQVAARLAAGLDAQLDLLHVLPTTDARSIHPRSEAAATAEDRLDELIREHVDDDVRAHSFARPGPPAPVIINLALQRHSDLLVLGTHGASGQRRTRLGSVGESVIRRAPCPALAVRPVERATPDLPGVLVSARPRTRRGAVSLGR